jgi:hypothetical protein
MGNEPSGSALTTSKSTSNSLYRIAQRIASNASHNTPLDFYFVLGKGVGQVLQPSEEENCELLRKAVQVLRPGRVTVVVTDTPH